MNMGKTKWLRNSAALERDAAAPELYLRCNRQLKKKSTQLTAISFIYRFRKGIR